MKENQQLNAWAQQMGEDWDKLAREDSMWAVASWPGKRKGDSVPWSQEEFFRIGEEEVRVFLALWGYEPTGSDRLLEIGSGLGRLSAAFARQFGEVHGVDISGEYVRLAQQLHQQKPNLHFSQVDGYSLDQFSDNFFDACFSFVVFQHIPHHEILRRYLSEIRRCLKPNGEAYLQFLTNDDVKLRKAMHGIVRSTLADVVRPVRRTIFRILSPWVSLDPIRNPIYVPISMNPVATRWILNQARAEGLHAVRVDRIFCRSFDPLDPGAPFTLFLFRKPRTY